MNLIKINKPSQVPQFTNVLDDIFNSSFSDLIGADFSAKSPSVNILENENSFLIELAVPGINKDNIDIQVEKDQLIISSAKEEVKDESDENLNFRKREFNYFSFKKSFHLPETIDSDKIDAQYENGVLKVKLEKLEAAKDKAPRSIKIK